MPPNTTVTHFRLQVWRYTPRGRNYVDNEVTAKFITKECDLKGWVVQPSPIQQSNERHRANFVPLEVDFQFKSGPEAGSRHLDHVANLIELFDINLEPRLDKFLSEQQRGSTTHALVLVPFGRSLADEVILKNTRVKIVRSLEIRSQTVVERNLITPIDRCELALHVLRASAKSADIASRVVKQLPVKWVTGASMVEEYDHLQAMLQSSPPSQSSDPNSAISVQDDIAQAWNNAEPCLDLMSTVIRHVSECLDFTSISKNKEIPPQQLYETMLGIRNANIFFSAYEGQMLDVNQRIPSLRTRDKKYAAKIGVGAATGVTVGALAACLLLALFTGGVGVVAVGTASGLGAVAGGSAGAGVGEYKIYEQTKLCETFSETINQLGDRLREANVALAVAYCSQVLQLPLHKKHLLSSQRDGVLRQLGVDVERLKIEDYEADNATVKLRRLLVEYKQFDGIREKVKKAAGVRARREVTSMNNLRLPSTPTGHAIPQVSPLTVGAVQINSQTRALTIPSAPQPLTESTPLLQLHSSRTANGHMPRQQQPIRLSSAPAIESNRERQQVRPTSTTTIQGGPSKNQQGQQRPAGRPTELPSRPGLRALKREQQQPVPAPSGSATPRQKSQQPKDNISPALQTQPKQKLSRNLAKMAAQPSPSGR